MVVGSYLRVDLVNSACLQLKENKNREYKSREQKEENFKEVFEKCIHQDSKQTVTHSERMSIKDIQNQMTFTATIMRNTQ